MTSVEAAGRIMEAMEGERRRRHYVPSWGRDPALFEVLGPEAEREKGDALVTRHGLSMNRFTTSTAATCGFRVLVDLVAYFGGSWIYVQAPGPIREAQLAWRVRQDLERAQMEVCRRYGIGRRQLEQFLAA